jgi:hypothetical protein
MLRRRHRLLLMLLLLRAHLSFSLLLLQLLSTPLAPRHHTSLAFALGCRGGVPIVGTTTIIV